MSYGSTSESQRENELNNQEDGTDEYIREHLPPKTYSNPKKGAGLLVGWLLLTAGAVACLSLSIYELWTTFFFFLQAIITVVLFTTSDRDRRIKNMLIYIGVVLLCSGGLVGLRFAFPDIFEAMNGRFMTNIVLAALCALGGGMAVFETVHYRKMKRRCTAPAEGTVVRLNSMKHRNGRVYSPVFRFGYQGKKYEASEYEFYSGNVPEVGDRVQIFVYPDDPVTIFDPKRAKRKVKFNVLVGILFFIIGAALMVLFAVSGFGLFEH